MFNPLLKKAKLNALASLAQGIMPIQTQGGMSMPTIKAPKAQAVPGVANPEKNLKSEEERNTRVPMTTSRGLKESQTKKIRNIIKP